MAFWIWKLEPGKRKISLQSLQLPQEIDTLDLISENLPAGAYTTLRTYHHNQALALEHHFQRLGQSAELAGKACKLDTNRLRAALRQALSEIPSGQEVRLRLTFDLEQNPGDVYVAAESLRVPTPSDYSMGVKAITSNLKRHLPGAKLTEFIPYARRVREDLAEDVNEAILIDSQGILLEGLSSNFFVVKCDEIFTAGERVLAGITRSLAIEVIDGLGIPLRRQAVSIDDLSFLQEAFITSSSRAVLPIISLDQSIIGSGKPGRFTTEIMEAYQALIDQRIQPI